MIDPDKALDKLFIIPLKSSSLLLGLKYLYCVNSKPADLIIAPLLSQI